MADITSDNLELLLLLEISPRSTTIGVSLKRELALSLLSTPIRYAIRSSTLGNLAVLRVSRQCREPAAETPEVAREACGFEAISKSHVTELPSLRLERSACETGAIVGSKTRSHRQKINQCVLYRTDLYHRRGGERCPIIH